MKKDGEENISYATTRGTLVTDASKVFRDGGLVCGEFIKVPYKGRHGRFAAGYLILKKEYSATNIPFVSYVLEKRKKMSARMFRSSGGRLKLTQALIFGDKEYLDAETGDRYLIAGISHLLAVSGTHVGVVALICFTLFYYLPLKFRMLAAGLALLTFVPLAGFKVTVMRSAFSAFIVMAAWFIDRKTDYRKLVLFLWGFFLLSSPALLGNASFMLSFTAVYGITSLSFKKTGWLWGSVKVGIAASAFTLPLSLFLFSTVNPAGIISTIVMLPVIYLQLVTGFIYILIPSLTIEPLAALEQLNLHLSAYLANITEPLFFLKSISPLTFGLLTLFLAVISRTKYTLASALVFLAVFIPVRVQDGLYFPQAGSYRAFIMKEGSRHEAYFSGTHSNFIYDFLPFASRFGVKNFDAGLFQTYGGVNLIFGDNGTDDFSALCVNDDQCEKPLIYMTRSNTIKKKNHRADKTYFIYKNELKADNIILLGKLAPLRYYQGSIYKE
jgi:competence protein ComEC